MAIPTTVPLWLGIDESLDDAFLLAPLSFEQKAEYTRPLFLE